MDTLWQDVKYGARVFLRNAGFTVPAVALLALGIGACTAMFSVVYGVLLSPLPYPEPDRIMQVWQVNRTESGTGNARASDPNFQDWKQQNHSFASLAEYSAFRVSVSGGSEPVRATVGVVSKEFFDALGVKPAIGRSFAEDEMREAGPPVALVGHNFWQRYLNGDSDTSKKQLTISSKSYSVIGVMPGGFSFPQDAEIWVPKEQFPANHSRTAHNWAVIGRLRNGVTLQQARSEMSFLARRMKEQYGEGTWMVDAAVVPLHEQIVGRVRPALLVLLAGVIFLMCVTCANVADLLLVQASGRQRELAVRLALGASRGRLARQFFVESLLLAASGGVLGVLVALWGVDLLRVLAPGSLPRTEQIAINAPVLAFAFGVAALSAAGLALVAVLRFTHREPEAALREGSRTLVGSEAGRRLRGSLVVAQFALTVVLLAGAGVVVRSFVRLLAVDPGFQTANILTMNISLPAAQDPQQDRRSVRLQEELLERLRQVPGVDEVGGVNSLPMSGGGSNGQFLVLNRPDEVKSLADFSRVGRDSSRIGYADYRIASEGYFRVMGIRLLRGRLFAASDAPDATHVAVITESLARTRWPTEDPLGKLIEFGNMDGDPRPFTIVGIVSDVRDRGLDSDVSPTLYGYLRQRPASSDFTVVMRGGAPPAQEIAAARAILRELSPDVPPRFRALEEVFAASLAPRRFSMIVLAVFGGAALLISAAGIYGTLAYAVAQRTREIGVRIALGAQRGQILRLIVREGMALAAVGVALGLVGAFATTRSLETLLYGVSAADPLTFAGVALALAAVALLACWIPARRASRVEPMIALRYE